MVCNLSLCSSRHVFAGCLTAPGSLSAPIWDWTFACFFKNIFALNLFIFRLINTALPGLKSCNLNVIYLASNVANLENLQNLLTKLKILFFECWGGYTNFECIVLVPNLETTQNKGKSNLCPSKSSYGFVYVEYVSCECLFCFATEIAIYNIAVM